jgi:ABC-2 type transport system ATP-binding protein
MLEVNDVVKKFKNLTAVDGVTFNVEKGKIFGFLGPNGAGKTTMIRMITNIYQPDSGEIKLLGEIVSSKQQNFIGYLPEERGLYKRLKVIDQLIYFAQLKNINRSQAIANAKKWLNRMEADSWANKKIQELSKGMQQKIQFIATVIHDPEILILDEPFSGFDPVNADLLRKIIHEIKREGKTIIFSTHIMEHAEKLCDDILLINKGQAILKGNLKQIKSSFGKNVLSIDFSGDLSFIHQRNDVEVTSETQNSMEIKLVGGINVSQEILKQALEKAEIHKFELMEPNLHEIFVDVVSKKETANELIER